MLFACVGLPQDRLLQCLQLCVSKFLQWQEKREEQGAEPEALPDIVEEAQEVLQSLVERMNQSDLEDFELVGREGGREGKKREGRRESLVVSCYPTGQVSRLLWEQCWAEEQDFCQTCHGSL